MRRESGKECLCICSDREREVGEGVDFFIKEGKFYSGISDITGEQHQERGSNSADILPRSGIHLNDIPFLDEKGDTNLGASFQGDQFIAS